MTDLIVKDLPVVYNSKYMRRVGIMTWNDISTRKKSEVIAMFDKAIKIASKNVK